MKKKAIFGMGADLMPKMGCSLRGFEMRAKRRQQFADRLKDMDSDGG